MAQVTEGDDVAESLRLVSAVLAALRDNDDGLPPIVRVCRACVALLPVDGAAISIIASSGHRQSLYASDAVAAHLETVQFSLGKDRVSRRSTPANRYSFPTWRRMPLSHGRCSPHR